ncbi:MAG TPA: aldehyde ferredoxin oxidoreductase family protein [Bacteroidales bacterium]|nr:aldehyde ferredoxin oxidoreductase family protein [Bacteroidales bacterium]
MEGYYNKLLRINLTSCNYSEEEIADDVLKVNIGGKGLGGYFMLKEIPDIISPFSPDNKIIFITGPAAGTKLWGNSRYGVFSKSPQTMIFGESYSGGKVAPQMKSTGYDVIILEGKSPLPVYLEISDKWVKFHDATHLWGNETYATEDQILKEINVPGAQAIVIGPAGENLVNFAVIENNFWRSAGRTGMGALMGSKKVKGIAFHGSSKCEIHNPDLLLEINKKISEHIKISPATVTSYRNEGTPMTVKVTSLSGSFPSNYWTTGTFKEWKKLTSAYMNEHFDVKSKACPNCFMSCGKLSSVRSGAYKGLTVEGPEYETIYAFGGLNCLGSLEEVVYLNDLCDRLGIDTITAGNVTAFAIEAYKRGKSDFEIDYGQTERVAELLKMIVYQKGVGKVFSKGVRGAAKELDLEDIAVHVKGLEPAGYEPRVLKGMGLAYAVSSRGACHLRGTFYKAELSGQIPADTIEGKAKLFIDWEDRCTLFDCLILCRFYRDFIKWDELSMIIEATTGMKYNKEELGEIANHITTQARRFNVREGITGKDDNLPPRFYKPLEDSGKVIKEEELNKMLQDYYKLRGWDETGIPKS